MRPLSRFSAPFFIDNVGHPGLRLKLRWMVSLLKQVAWYLKQWAQRPARGTVKAFGWRVAAPV
jgi:hypothetical protein